MCFVGSALNVSLHDVSAGTAIALSLMMHASPFLYSLALVKRKLLEEHIADDWSGFLHCTVCSEYARGDNRFVSTRGVAWTADGSGSVVGGIIITVTRECAHPAPPAASKH